MEPDELKPNHWYWVRRGGGAIVPYRFHKLRVGKRFAAEFFIGSFLCEIPISDIIAESLMPKHEATDSDPSGSTGTSP